MNELPTLTTEQKLMIREAQYAVTRANDMVRAAQDKVIQIVQGIARDLGVTEPGVMFQFDTLSFERRTDTVQGRPYPLE
jgi:hypothetical protein